MFDEGLEESDISQYLVLFACASLLEKRLLKLSSHLTDLITNYWIPLFGIEADQLVSVVALSFAILG